MSVAREWIEQGIEQGRQEGEHQGRVETARNLINRMQLDDTAIAEITGLSEQEVSDLRTRY